MTLRHFARGNLDFLGQVKKTMAFLQKTAASVGPQIKIAADSKELSRMAAEQIVHRITQAMPAKRPFSLVLSGGSTPRGLFSLLANEPSLHDRLPWQDIHFFWADERHVPPDHPDSNYRLAHDIMLSKIPVPSANVHRVRAELPDAADAAEEYEQDLRAFFDLEVDQLPRFDCILLGMGTDGHTASLFPGTRALYETRRLVAANWVKKLQTYRITLTLPVLTNAGCVVFIVAGKEKAGTVTQVLEGNDLAGRFPAGLVRPPQSKLIWILDRAAAGNLKTAGKKGE